jgi:hypothetical protein
VVCRDIMKDFSLTLLIYVKVYQFISRLYVKTLYERTKNMMVVMCTCITHTRTRVFHVLRMACDLRRSRRGMVCLMSILFLCCVFYWLILSHLDYVNHDWLHVERFQGCGSWNLGRSNLLQYI